MEESLSDTQALHMLRHLDTQDAELGLQSVRKFFRVLTPSLDSLRQTADTVFADSRPVVACAVERVFAAPTHPPFPLR